MADEEHRTQPEFSTGERVARLEALYEAFIRSERGWQEQMDGRFSAMKAQIEVQRNERRDEIEAVRREMGSRLDGMEKAVDKAQQAQEKQNELTREDAKTTTAALEERVRATERGESSTTAVKSQHQQSTTQLIAFAGVLVLLLSASITLILHVAGA